MQIGSFNLFNNYVSMNGLGSHTTGLPPLGNGYVNGLDNFATAPQNGIVDARGVGNVLQHNSDLMGWIGLCNRTEFIQSYMAEMAADIKSFYKGCDKRLAVLESDYLRRTTDDAHQEEFQRLQTKYEKVRADLERQGRFPDKEELKSERERLRILYYQMRDLALQITSVPEDMDDHSPSITPAVPRQKPSDPLYAVGDVIPALKNSPSRLALGMQLRPHQEKALHVIRREIRLSQENEDFAHDDMIIGLPTGSGKTRVMAGTMAMAIKEGWVHFKQGDKIIVTTHRNNIGDQNLQTIQEQLGPLFEEKFGRPLHVSRFDKDHKDVGGDVIVVSIPSGLSKGKKNKPFFTAVGESLGGTGRLAMLMMDEVHHEDAPSWQKFKDETLAIADRRGNNIKVLGFTGTPKIEQRARVIYEMSQHEAMVKGIIPLTDIVTEKTGQRLEKINKNKKGEFTDRSLSGVVDVEPRNKRIMEIMADRAIRNEVGNGFAATLTFAVDLKHADNLADMHVSYFGSKGRRRPEEAPLFNRKIVKAERGITLRKLRALLRAKEKGDIDAIVAVVYGKTKPAVLDLLFKEALKGNIEAIYNCQKLEEGTDAYWARNLVGARPSLSFIRRPQEAGRIFRRDPREVDEEGRLLDIPLRRLIDIEDEYYEGHLVSYREVLGMRHMIPMPGVLYSLATQEPVNTEERDKEREMRVEMRRRRAQKEETEPRFKNDYEGVREALADVLTENYQGDLALMARDLNMKPQELEDLLTVEGLRLTWHEIRHLERLLYLDQGKLVQNASAGKLERLQTSLVQEVLLESLKFYLASEDKAWEAQEISYKAGDEDQVFELKKQHLVELGTRTLKLSTMNLIASALYYVFKEANEQAIFKEYQDRVQQVMDSFYGEQEGEKRLNRLQGQMLWDRALQGIQEQSQRLTPKKRKEFISRWYRYEHPGITEIPKILYITTNSNGAKSGRIDKGLIIRNQDEFDRWNGTNDKNYPKIQIKWDEQLGWLVERDSLVNGVTVQYILKSLIDAGFVQESYEQELRRLTSVSLDDLNNPRIKELLLHIAQKKGGSIFYLVGLQAATSTLGDHDKISGGLAFFTEQEYTEWLPKRAYHHPQARIKHIDGAFTINKQSDLKGPNTQEIFVKMVDYSLLAEASEFKLARLTRGQPLSILSDPKVGELIHDVATSKNEHEYYIVGGSGGISDGNIVRGLEILTNEEFDQWPHKDKKYYPKIRIQACLGGWFVGHHADVCGTHAYDLLLALFENQVLMKGLEWLFTDVTAVSISDFENPEIKRLFEEIVKAKGEKKYYIVTPRQGPLQQGILQGGLRILTEEEYQKWEGKGRKHFFAFGIEFDEDLGWMGPANHKLDRPVEKGLKILELILKANLITQDPEQELRTMLINTPVTTLQNPRVNELIYFIMERKQIQTGYIIAGKGGVLANKIVGKVRVLSEAEFNDWEEKENELFPRIKIKKQGDDLVVVEMDGKKASGKGGTQILKALVVTGTLVG